MGLAVLYLSRGDIERLELGMDEIINCVEEAFCEQGEGKNRGTPKPI